MTAMAAQGGWKETVRGNIRQGAELDVPFLLMNALAATIACYGLFANSPAIIIGAMIVAMLLGPITGVALALVDSDPRLLFRSLMTVLAGTAEVMAIALVIGLIHRGMPITDEIMARTAPNLLDLMVALAGGAAGAYASISSRLGVAFVGVAIATALVPPLCAACILFAHGYVGLGLGALLLTFTNMVAIQFASSVVLWMSGFRRASRMSGLSLQTLLRRNFVSIAILAVLAVVLTRSLHKTLERQFFETAIRFSLNREIDASPGCHVAEVRFETARGDGFEGKTIVRAVVRGPHPPTAAQVAAMERGLPVPPDGTSLELRIRFVETHVIGREGPLYEDEGFRIGE